MFEKIRFAIEMMTEQERRRLRAFSDSGELVELIDRINAEEKRESQMASVFAEDED